MNKIKFIILLLLSSLILFGCQSVTKKIDEKTTEEEIDEYFDSIGIKKVPDDHPIYNESPSIMFSNKIPKKK